MPARSQEALERKRARNRAWHYTHPKTAPPSRPENYEGEDLNWMILSCEGCGSFFDVRKGVGRRRPKLCEDCR